MSKPAYGEVPRFEMLENFMDEMVEKYVQPTYGSVFQQIVIEDSVMKSRDIFPEEVFNLDHLSTTDVLDAECIRAGAKALRCKKVL